jgi:hypothetical protein
MLNIVTSLKTPVKVMAYFSDPPFPFRYQLLMTLILLVHLPIRLFFVPS